VIFIAEHRFRTTARLSAAADDAAARQPVVEVNTGVSA
jgi:hypothetical protein